MLKVIIKKSVNSRKIFHLNEKPNSSYKNKNK